MPFRWRRNPRCITDERLLTEKVGHVTHASSAYGRTLGNPLGRVQLPTGSQVHTHMPTGPTPPPGQPDDATPSAPEPPLPPSPAATNQLPTTLFWAEPPPLPPTGPGMSRGTSKLLIA